MIAGCRKSALLSRGVTDRQDRKRQDQAGWTIEVKKIKRKGAKMQRRGMKGK
jgi:hypothetical protein